MNGLALLNFGAALAKRQFETSQEEGPNQMWKCERCPTWTADPMWRDGQIVCADCAHDAQFKPAKDEPCPFL